jgi:hypothetical protein
MDSLDHGSGVDQDSSTGGGRIWVIVKVDPYRNLLDYLPSSLSENLVWSGNWHHVSVRAYTPILPGAGLLAPNASPPAWLLAWPSPVDEKCQKRE